MPDLKDLETRLKKIEDRFNEIDKKLEERQEAKRSIAEEEPVIIEGSDRLKTLDDMRERMQELEDLLLLIELENTKLRESIGAGGTEITPAVAPDINERLRRLEEQAFSARGETTTKDIEDRIHEIEVKLESRLEELAKSKGEPTKDIDKILEKYDKKIQELQERIERIEKAPRMVTRVEKITTKPKEEESTLLEEVQMILKK